jgi:hypothetical protein
MNKLILALFASLTLLGNLQAGTCYGDAGCTACSTCNYCKHCNEGGGTCGVREGTSAGRGSRRGH